MKNYIMKIKTKLSLYSKKKTSNIFDGSYKSIYQGNGLDFENLREYIPGDSIRDIDWKASSRSGKVLIKRYIAEKKHNVMLVFDTGKSMSAHTDSMDEKKEIALYVGGIIGYMAAKNGDNVGAIYNRNTMIQYFPFRTGLGNIERILTEYDREKFDDYETDIEKTLDYIVRTINRRMIVVVITDAMGIANIQHNTLKKLSYQHDVLFVSINDATVSGRQTYDVEDSKYIPDFISGNKELLQMQQSMKASLDAANEKKLNQNRIVSTCIDNEEEIVEKIIELLGGQAHANNR
ncbi:MAG: DUF58 domain-containing protein [Lachnospiraceae bacterium]|nr:DUF58 domain-containing protein [Lachnospiraceae bacterium]MEE0686489.1 DUF58 domain-containing protein [Lachnospiraceae bacterium]